MNDWHDFPGPNAGYVLELYDRFRQNPESVDAATRAYLATWSPPAETAARAAPEHALEKIVGAVNLAQAIRAYGHLAARLDPLGSSPRGDPILLPSTHGVTEDDLRQLPASLICGPVMECAANAWKPPRLCVRSTRPQPVMAVLILVPRTDWLRHAAESVVSGRRNPPAPSV
jgi:2-oxoglutarate dehydrogenase E1 component